MYINDDKLFSALCFLFCAFCVSTVFFIVYALKKVGKETYLLSDVWFCRQDYLSPISLFVVLRHVGYITTRRDMRLIHSCATGL